MMGRSLETAVAAITAWDHSAIGKLPTSVPFMLARTVFAALAFRFPSLRYGAMMRTPAKGFALRLEVYPVPIR
jgi:hypothetical protein